MTRTNGMFTSLIICRSDGRKSPAALVSRIPSTRFDSSNSMRALLFLQGVVAVAEQKVVALFQRGVLGPANHHREKWIRNIRHDHTDGLRLLFAQAARDEVGTIIELANRIFDPLAQILSHMALLLITAETVKIETPDSRATSEMLAAFPGLVALGFLEDAIVTDATISGSFTGFKMTTSCLSMRYRDWGAESRGLPHQGHGRRK